MKIAYILIALLIIGGVWWYLDQPQPEVTIDETAFGVEDTPTNREAGNDVLEDTDVEMEDDSNNEGGGDSANIGTDAGMEFPTDESNTNIEAGAAAGASAGTGADTEGESEEHILNITGTNHKFSQETIRVNVGDTITINFTSGEGFHDWVIDAFNASTDRVQAGQSTSVTFVADEAGTFEYYCSVGNHRAMGMVGTLIVE